MKISKNTMSLLANFSHINPNILINPGNEISTITTTNNLLAEAKVEETFPTKFGIFDLPKTLSAMSLLDNPEFIFGDKSVTFSSGKSKFTQNYSDPSLLKYPTKKVNIPDFDYSLTINKEHLSEIVKAASVMNVQDLSIFSKEGVINALVFDKKNSSSDQYLVEELGTSNRDFNAYFKISTTVGLFLSGSYDVKIAAIKKVANFKNTSGIELQYWCGVEQDSDLL